MIDEHIRSGDYVVCERRNSPYNGETVVALLPDGDATLKKFYREGNRVRLQPANPNFEPIYVDNVQIQGVVVGVIRTM
jgi:repressor LexA